MLTATGRIQEFIESVKKEDEPLCAYVYDLKKLAGHARFLKESLPEYCRLFYAMKANPDPKLLEVLDGIIDGFEAASAGEIATLKNITRKPILFGCPAKKEYEIERVIAGETAFVNIESIHDANRLQFKAEETGQKIPVLFRVNLSEDVSDSRLKMAGVPTQFGIDERQIPELLSRRHDFPNLEIKGFHFHAMSNNLDSLAHLAFIRICLQKAVNWKAMFRLDASVVNAGGGIGINYFDPDKPFNWADFSMGLQEMEPDFAVQGFELFLELGRYLVGESGYYAAEVIDVKENHGEWFALIRGGSHHFRLPAAWKMSQPFSVISRGEWKYPFERPAVRESTVTIAGELCTPNDVLARDVPVEELKAGDIVIFQYAGAYGWTISHHDFLSHPHPKRYYLSE